MLIHVIVFASVSDSVYENHDEWNVCLWTHDDVFKANERNDDDLDLNSLHECYWQPGFGDASIVKKAKCKVTTDGHSNSTESFHGARTPCVIHGTWNRRPNVCTSRET
jgi:hypothetical protein